MQRSSSPWSPAMKRASSTDTRTPFRPPFRVASFLHLLVAQCPGPLKISFPPQKALGNQQFFFFQLVASLPLDEAKCDLQDFTRPRPEFLISSWVTSFAFYLETSEIQERHPRTQECMHFAKANTYIHACLPTCHKQPFTSLIAEI